MVHKEMGSEHSLYEPKLAEVTFIKQLTEKEKLYRLRLRNGDQLTFSPGQFIEISLFGIGEAPISLASSPTRNGCFELGIRAVGNVTRALTRLNVGAVVGVRGPFGNGFPLAKLKGRDLLLVAGGVGLFPLRSMIQYAVDNRNYFGEVFILYGCREPAEQLFQQELRELRQRDDFHLLESVDRCPSDAVWEGNIGVITTLLPQIEINPKLTAALVVGPPVMYRYVVLECIRKGLAEDQIYMSLERRMKCGIGFCGHCQINNTYVCQEGPVYSYEQIRKLKGTEV